MTVLLLLFSLYELTLVRQITHWVVLLQCTDRTYYLGRLLRMLYPRAALLDFLRRMKVDSRLTP